MWGRIIRTVNNDLIKSNYIYYYQKYLHKSLVLFLPLDGYYVDAHLVTDAKQHGQEVLGYVQYAFSG
jgi:hypothetical protein